MKYIDKYFRFADIDLLGRWSSAGAGLGTVVVVFFSETDEDLFSLGGVGGGV